ncbi:hypothetical protein CAC42_6539 [Sphaceloma murrayae]|uniref:Uncharacterized protein n=1 Tax=Sphaceloma murrayae TaxID=2082308 RepID=A0A2K1QFS7_9PEZI|nr:hypothetical protein CAC42_6539 [Sphaceloma murrayae]
MDLDQRSRMLTSRAGRIILLGDGGAEFHADADSADQDADMFDQSDDEEKDLESQVKKGQSEAASDRSQREETPGPEAAEKTKSSQQQAAESAKEGTGPGLAPEEPKMGAVSDGKPKES